MAQPRMRRWDTGTAGCADPATGGEMHIVEQTAAGVSVNIVAWIATVADTGIVRGACTGAARLSRSLLVVTMFCSFV